MPRASQHGPLRLPALKYFFEINLYFKGFHEVNTITAHAGTAHGTSGIITFGEKDPEATLLGSFDVPEIDFPLYAKISFHTSSYLLLRIKSNVICLH